MPGVFPPITLRGGRYMDGGLRSATNADLAAGARVLVVVEPLAHLLLREAPHREIEVVGPDTVVTVVPDKETITAFGPNPLVQAAWEPSYQAGVRQADAVAERLSAAWQQQVGTG
ncbi:hypothetical protein GTS_53860 [Gandjariella thermophila]|uniref:PNPLA domain-containing protein n=1 Tax=Gandjariella thermophila TaxID=1931992 RepID=A0A4D4JIN7_9PSEU|nr:hypothetical protein GTS_53860 [Gandjariella thermophila]